MVVVPYITIAELQAAQSQIPAIQRETGRTIEIIAGVIRNNAGTWEFIEDATHYGRSGCLSVTTSGTGMPVITYNKTYDNIISFIATPDETYAKNGVTMGSSVLRGSAEISMYKSDQSDYITYNSTTGLFTSTNNIFPTMSYASGVLTITTENFGTTYDVQATARDTSAYDVRIGSVNNVSAQIKFYNPDGTQYTGVANTNMKLYFSRRGTYSLTTANSAFASSNIWFVGVFQL